MNLFKRLIEKWKKRRRFTGYKDVYGRPIYEGDTVIVYYRYDQSFHKAEVVIHRFFPFKKVVYAIYDLSDIPIEIPATSFCEKIS